MYDKCQNLMSWPTNLSKLYVVVLGVIGCKGQVIIIRPESHWEKVAKNNNPP